MTPTRRLNAADVVGPREPCVYQVNDAGGQPLYVGYSRTVMSRLREHRHARWWDEAGHILITEYTTVAEARAAERRLIVELLPAFNLAGTGRELNRRPFPDDGVVRF